MELQLHFLLRGPPIVQHLDEVFKPGKPGDARPDFQSIEDHFKATMVWYCLKHTKGRVGKAAEMLGMSPSALRRRMRKYGYTFQSFRPQRGRGYVRKRKTTFI